MRFLIAVMTFVFSLAVQFPLVAQETFAAEEIDAKETAQESDEAQRDADQTDSGLSDAEKKQVDLWIEDLASREFAVRERAGESLLNIGNRVVPHLREQLAATDDPEVILRARKLISHMNDGDLESKLTAFLDGEQVELEGWLPFRSWFGDSYESRKTFVKILRGFPQTVQSLGGTPRAQTLAMNLVYDQLYAGGRQLRMPTVPDAIALLLPAADRRVPIKPEVESQLLFMLRMHPVNRVPRDPVLGPAFRGLVDAWIRRSTMTNRERVFDYCLQNQLESAYSLAMETLDNSDDPHILALSLQVIAKFGSVKDTLRISEFVSDTRKLALVLRGGRQMRTELGDAAIAAIARLHKVPLTELGFPENAESEAYGFIYEELSYAGGDDASTEAEQRSAATEKIGKLIEQVEVNPFAPPLRLP